MGEKEEKGRQLKNRNEITPCVAGDVSDDCEIIRGADMSSGMSALKAAVPGGFFFRFSQLHRCDTEMSPELADKIGIVIKAAFRADFRDGQSGVYKKLPGEGEAQPVQGRLEVLIPFFFKNR